MIYFLSLWVKKISPQKQIHSCCFVCLLGTVYMPCHCFIVGLKIKAPMIALAPSPYIVVFKVIGLIMGIDRPVVLFFMTVLILVDTS